MLTNGFPYNPLRPLKRIRLREARGTRWLMGFFSSRVLRGGPRLLAYLTGCLVLSFLALRFVSQELSQAAVGTSRAVWHWHTGETWDATSIRIDQENALGYGEDGLGNLRIVVFGEQDIATPSWRDETAPSWTDVLCQQVCGEVSIDSLIARLTDSAVALLDLLIVCSRPQKPGTIHGFYWALRPSTR